MSLQLGKQLGQNPRTALPAGTTTGHHGSPWRPRFFRQQLRIGVYEIHRRREVGPLGAGMVNHRNPGLPYQQAGNERHDGTRIHLTQRKDGNKDAIFIRPEVRIGLNLGASIRSTPHRKKNTIKISLNIVKLCAMIFNVHFMQRVFLVWVLSVPPIFGRGKTARPSARGSVKLQPPKHVSDNCQC